MQKRVLGLIALTVLLSSPTLSFAESKTNINISNNGDNSSSNVKVNNNLSNETHITIESNGEKKEYHGSDQNVHLELGTNNVKINNNNTSSNPTSSPKPTQLPTATPAASASASPVVSPTPENTITIEGDVLGATTQKEKETVLKYFARILSSIWEKLF